MLKGYLFNVLFVRERENKEKELSPINLVPRNFFLAWGPPPSQEKVPGNEVEVL